MGKAPLINAAFLLCMSLTGSSCQALQIPKNGPQPFIQRKSAITSSLKAADSDSFSPVSFEEVVKSRYACTRFHRYDKTISSPSSPTASKSNFEVVTSAKSCLEISRRSPSGFNAQPYKLLLVYSNEKKEALAKNCIGRNADRVRDSDCTVLFLADKECLREYKRFGNFLEGGDSGSLSRSRNQNKKMKSKWAKRKIQGLILLFSSGWPLPRLIANPLSFSIRTAVSAVSVLTRRKILVPSLGSAETWATKNTMLVAMTYMLSCTSSGLSTCPMEGYNVGGIRRALNIPKRYSIPLIVSTGVPFEREAEEEGEDDVGMEHGTSSKGISLTKRYPSQDVIFENEM